MVAAEPPVEFEEPSPAPRRVRPTITSKLLAVGLVIGVVGGYAFWVEVYPGGTGGTGRGQPPIVSVAVSPSYSLVGAAAQYASVAFCKSGATSPGSDWLCSFSIKNVNGSSPNPIYLDFVSVANASEDFLLPVTPVAVTSGSTAVFALTIHVPSNSATLGPEVVFDVGFV